jgi:hypothetical protein
MSFLVRKETCNDVFAAVVPDDIHPSAGLSPALYAAMDQMARRWVWAQWADGGAPLDIEFAASDWLITDKVYAVDQFQPAHDCQECRSGNEKSKAFLRANPGRWIAMANLTYVEVWPVKQQSREDNAIVKSDSGGV